MSKTCERCRKPNLLYLKVKKNMQKTNTFLKIKKISARVVPFETSEIKDGLINHLLFFTLLNLEKSLFVYFPLQITNLYISKYLE